jgi:DNA-binding response OmpR family regulator
MEKVLVIEDNRMMRLFLINYLGQHHDVSAVENPSEAIKWLESNDATLIISDYYSKGTKEFNELNKVKSLSGWTNTPMIILTDSDKSEQRINALELGVADCLSKPFNPVELNLRVNSIKNINQLKVSYRPVA